MCLSSDLEQPLDLTSKPSEERILGSLKIKATSSSLSVPWHLAPCFVYGSSSLNICWRNHQTNQLGSGVRSWNILKRAKSCVKSRRMYFCPVVHEAMGYWDTGILRLPGFHGFGSANSRQSVWLEVESEEGTEGKVATWAAMNSHQAGPTINRSVLK